MSPPQPVKRRRKNPGMWSYREDDSMGQVGVWIQCRGHEGKLRWYKTTRSPELVTEVLHLSSREEDGTPTFIKRGKNGVLDAYYITKYQDAELTIEVILFPSTEKIQCDCGNDNHAYLKACVFAMAVMRLQGLLRVNEDWIALGKKAPEPVKAIEGPKPQRALTEAELERAAKKSKGGRPKKEPHMAPDAVRHAAAAAPTAPTMPATPRDALPSMQQAIRDGYYPVAICEDGVWTYTICKSIAERNELMRSSKPASSAGKPRTREEQMPLEAIADAAWRLRDDKPLTPHLVEEATTPPVKYGDSDYPLFAKRIFNSQKAWTKVLREVHHHDAEVIDSSWTPPGADPASPKLGIGQWIITKLPPKVT